MVQESPEEELRLNLASAEKHTQRALDLLYEQKGPKRSFWYRATLGRAQSILMSLYMQELRRARHEQRGKEHGGDLQS